MLGVSLKRMKAAVLKAPFNLSLEDVPAPSIASDEVLVKVKACGICGSDIHYFKGLNPWSLHTLGIDEPMPPNIILGHEVSGEVVEVGSPSTSHRKGERVGVIAFKSCGECYHCKIGLHNLCGCMKHIGHDGRWGEVAYTPGGLAEFCPVWEDKACRLPESVSFEEATQLDGLAVAVHALNRSKLRKGGYVAIVGCGPIGLMAMQVAKAFGAGVALSIDRWGKPLEIAGRLGADVAINSVVEGVVERVMEETRGDGVDLVLDTVGSAETIVQSLKILRRGGSLVILAGFTESITIDLKLLSGERLITSSSNNLYPDYYTAIELLKEGRVEVKPLITHKFPLSEIKEAFNVAMNKERYGAIKVVVNP